MHTSALWGQDTAQKEVDEALGLDINGGSDGRAGRLGRAFAAISDEHARGESSFRFDVGSERFERDEAAVDCDADSQRVMQRTAAEAASLKTHLEVFA